MFIPSRFTIAGVSFPAGVAAGVALAVWLLGWQGCAHRVETRWATRPVQTTSTKAADEWAPDARDCAGDRVTFRKPSRKEVERLIREYRFTAAELGAEPGTRTVTVPVPGEDRFVEVPVDRPLPLFKERSTPKAPWGGKEQPYLDAVGDLQSRFRANPEPLTEVPSAWGGWLKVAWAGGDVDPSTVPGLDGFVDAQTALQADQGIALAGVVTYDLWRWHRLNVVPFVEVGRAPGLDNYWQVGTLVGFKQLSKSLRSYGAGDDDFGVVGPPPR